MSKPCVFFDRDGIVNRPPTLDRYVRNRGEFELIPAFIDALRIVRDRGYEAVIVTNQKGVSTGRMTQQDVDGIHDHLIATLKAHGLGTLDLFVCTAGDDSHPHRKPNPGMILEAARKHDLDLTRSWMVGDNEKDVEAGRRAGCKTVLVSEKSAQTAADHQVLTMENLPSFLEATLPRQSAV
jgi:D-glycero-D-manno-heptose 1,7-bisphosphate phosphatase